MTTGKQLKTMLGLDDFKYVRIARALTSSYRILFVYYDSYRKTMPVTNYRIKKAPFVSTMLSGTDIYHGGEKSVGFTPPMDIDDYNGLIRGSLIVPVNLAGDRFIDSKQFSKVIESVAEEENKPLFQFNRSLLEFVTLYDLMAKETMSDFTATWRKDRNRTMGAENITAKLIDCYVDEADKSVTFGFLTEPTTLNGKDPNDNINSRYRTYSGDKGEVDPDNSFKINTRTNATYELQIKILDFFEWLKVFEGEKIGEQEMKDILKVSNVQVFSTSPSFQYQGFNYWMTQIDGSIYPETRAPERWNAAHLHGNDGAFLDKHLYGLLRQIKFWMNPMASMLNKKLKDRGLI